MRKASLPAMMHTETGNFLEGGLIKEISVRHPKRQEQMDCIAGKAGVENHVFLCGARALQKIFRVGRRHYRQLGAADGGNKLGPRVRANLVDKNRAKKPCFHLWI